ncbi:Protein DipZ [Austwickia sp. TVS 96-490-7B]|uniref:cytochrome c biogenesis CcdA family protein n=1 Tax=Austwickia sp. TVS 96-490-7B TaxID=2830843 RepID=UPI001C559AC4|nr:cytochrome c biogenesis protein CcdA [Austwickia sp. TVS 96-490-7B]MBW3084996.1 Protein DipZ [Austwickia sp. TVS 96-490-7B]
MTLFVGALLAGVLTVLAPCVLPLLPITVAGSAVPGERWSGTPRALLVTASLGMSVVVFTVLLKASTALIEVPARAWPVLSGLVLVVMGAVTVFPQVWDMVSAWTGWQARSGAGLGAARRRSGAWGAILTGAALGPAFSSCSPLYAYVVVTVLPAQFGQGLVLLSAYAVGLCAMLLLVALAGQRVIRRLGWAADPHGSVRRGLGVVMVAIGLMVLTGVDHQLQTWIVQYSPVAPWDLDRMLLPEGS